MLHIAKRLDEILGRDYGIEKSYRGPFIMFVLQDISENTVQRDSMKKKTNKQTSKQANKKLICSPCDCFANVSNFPTLREGCYQRNCLCVRQFESVHLHFRDSSYKIRESNYILFNPSS